MVNIKDKIYLNFMIIALIIFSISQLNCNTSEPKIEDDNIQIELYDVSASEIYLHIKINNSNPGTVFVFRGSKVIFANLVASTDTIITDSELSENTYYKYTVIKKSENNIETVKEIRISTLNLTSHEIVWKTYEFGSIEHSTLHDIFIIDENEIWAVGEFYLEDSAGGFDPDYYGAAKWDGNKWNFIRFQAKAPEGYWVKLFLRGIYAFSSKDIWFVNGSPYHFLNNSLTAYWLSDFPGYPNPIWGVGKFGSKIWGVSPSIVYACGDKGALAYFDGSRWNNLEVDFQDYFVDMWGTEDKAHLYFSALDFYRNNNKIFHIKDPDANPTDIKTLPWDPAKSVNSVWSNKGFPVYVAGDSLFDNRTGIWNVTTNEVYDPLKVRGSELNNIYVVGFNDLIVHYNGRDWKNISNNSSKADFYSALAVKNNIVAIGGNIGKRIRILIGSN